MVWRASLRCRSVLKEDAALCSRYGFTPAIIAVEILGAGPEMEFDLHNPKVLAAIVCTLVSLRFDLIWVVISGVASLIFFNKSCQCCRCKKLK
ncbi:hypothetical protein O9929_27580 [Vibrio lentus]|nr:hypothetical protein [Vibrio lentus]